MIRPAIAIIAGSGDLPKRLAEECRRKGLAYHVVLFGNSAPAWMQAHPRIGAEFERVGQLLADLHRAGCGEVVFAGAMVRPDLDPAKLDRLGLALAETLRRGDGATLQAIAAVFAGDGFRVVGAHQILEDLLAPVGIWTRAQPSDSDKKDAARAMAVVAALGTVDVGQAAVVADGICLGVESIQGTDVLLNFVAESAAAYRRGRRSGGVLAKAPKPGQDWRTDLPAIGPQTMANAARAGLSGVVVQAGGVLVLGLAETVAEADRLGLFLWGRGAG